MNETEIGRKLREAVGDAPYPPELKARIELRLREPATPPHPRLLGLIAASLAVIIVMSLIFIRIQSGRFPIPQLAASPSASATPLPMGTPQTVGDLPAADLAAGDLTSAAIGVGIANQSQTSDGRTIRLIGAYADPARIVLIIRTLPEATPMVQISDDAGPINSGWGITTGVIGDAVVTYLRGPHVAADGLAHLQVTISNLGSLACPSLSSSGWTSCLQQDQQQASSPPPSKPGVWNFAFSLKVQAAEPLALQPTLSSVGSWKVTVEKFEVTPSVIHLRGTVDGPSSIDVSPTAFMLLDGSGNPLSPAGSSLQPKGSQRSTQVDETWARPAGPTTYQLRVVGGGSAYTSNMGTIPAPPTINNGKGGKFQPLTPYDFPAATESIDLRGAMVEHLTAGRPQSCGSGSGPSGSIFSFATYFQYLGVWYYVGFNTDPAVLQYHGPATYATKADIAVVSQLGPTVPIFTGTAQLTVESDTGLHRGKVNGTLRWADDPTQTISISGAWTCMWSPELGPG